MKVYSPSIIENLIVSGSSSFTGSLNVQGTISASNLVGTITTAETASYVEFTNVDGLTSFSSSVDSRLVAQEDFSSSLDATFATDSELSSVSSSFDTRVGTVESDVSALETRAGLLESATASLDGRLDVVETTTASLEVRTGLLESATSSLDARLDSVETTTASFGSRLGAIETVTSSLNTRVTDLESFSSSLDTEFATDAELSSVSSSFNTRINTVDDNIDAVEVRTGLLESATASLETRAGLLELATASLDGRLDAVESTTASFGGRLNAIETTTSSLNTRVTDLESFSSSLDTIFATDSELSSVSSSFNTRVGIAEADIDALEVRAGLLESATASLDNRVDAIETTTSSLNGRVGAIEVTTSSLLSQVSSLQGQTGSYAVKNASNIFTGTQTITGSLFVTNDLIVQGSSSLQNITASAVSIGTNIIKLNEDSPAVRYAGIQVVDSGSTGVTASLLFDSLNNDWVFTRNGATVPTGVESSILVYGPLNTGSLGDEQKLTANYILKVEDDGDSHGHHLTTSSIFEPSDGSRVEINTDVTSSGNVKATRFEGVFKGAVSQSSQINHDSTTGFVANEHIDHSTVSITAGNGLTGGGTITANRTLAVGAGTGITVNADDVALTGQALALHNLTTNGVIARTGTGTVAGRTITAGTGISISNGDGVSGNPTITALNNGTVTSIATGNGITGGTITSTGTLGLTGQALALHNLATSGLIARTGAGTVAGRTLTAGTGIDVTNGDGVSGNPTVAVDVSDFMTNGSDNRIVTATGTDAMNAEANLTFNGNSLNLTGTGTTLFTNSLYHIFTNSGTTGQGMILGYHTGTGVGGLIAGDASGGTENNLVIGGYNGSAWGEVMRIKGGGNVGIGTTTPSQKLHVVGQIVATNEITAFFSDERLKTKVNDVTNALDIVNKLNPFRYVSNELANAFGFDSDNLQIGLSAQEVQRVVPEIVKLAPFDMERDEDNNLISKSGENYLTLDYAKLVPVLVQAIKELKAELDEVKKNCNTSSN
jgi:hypothetical protein